MKKSIILILISFFALTGFMLQNEDNSSGNQRAYYQHSKPQAIDFGIVKEKKGQLYYQFFPNQRMTATEIEPFGWLDKKAVYFKAYLINTTNDTIESTTQDGSLIMIQEALNKKGEWQPIEYWVHSGCGNSYFNPLMLAPGNFVVVPIRKYQGNFETKIRLKWKNGKETYYSEPFEGSINTTQFEKETKNVGGILYQGPASYLD